MLIDIEPHTILTWREFDRADNPNDKSYQTMKEKVRQGLWQPEPPIVISPMPPDYSGKYQFFMYNGHTRHRVFEEGRQEYELSLKGLVVSKDEEIPLIELINHGAFGLRSVLQHLICRKIQPHPTIDPFWFGKYGLSYLVRELNRWEQNQKKTDPN